MKEQSLLLGLTGDMPLLRVYNFVLPKLLVIFTMLCFSISCLVKSIPLLSNKKSMTLNKGISPVSHSNNDCSFIISYRSQKYINLTLQSPFWWTYNVDR